LEGYFAVRYGAEAKEILAKYYPFIGMGLVAAIVAYFVIRGVTKRHLTKTQRRKEEVV
jgi:hypothetical protein